MTFKLLLQRLYDIFFSGAIKIIEIFNDALVASEN